MLHVTARYGPARGRPKGPILDCSMAPYVGPFEAPLGPPFWAPKILLLGPLFRPLANSLGRPGEAVAKDARFFLETQF